MILDCGPSFAERALAEHNRVTKWHLFFILWPRRISGKCVWLHTVLRKLTWERGGYDECSYYKHDFRLLESDARKYGVRQDDFNE